MINSPPYKGLKPSIVSSRVLGSAPEQAMYAEYDAMPYNASINPTPFSIKKGNSMFVKALPKDAPQMPIDGPPMQKMAGRL